MTPFYFFGDISVYRKGKGGRRRMGGLPESFCFWRGWEREGVFVLSNITPFFLSINRFVAYLKKTFFGGILRRS